MCKISEARNSFHMYEMNVILDEEIRLAKG